MTLVVLASVAAVAVVAFAGGYSWAWLGWRATVEGWHYKAALAHHGVVVALGLGGIGTGKTRRERRLDPLDFHTWRDLQEANRLLGELDKELARAWHGQPMNGEGFGRE
jgi:hypothetical protein